MAMYGGNGKLPVRPDTNPESTRVGKRVRVLEGVGEVLGIEGGSYEGF